MKTVKVKLNNTSEVLSFVHKAEQIDCDLDLSKRSTTVDAKSVLGVLSLDISEPLTLTIHNESADISDFEEFIVQ